jgi:choline dehydrogenase
MLSGIGPGARLAALGLPVRADLPGVGENLQDHLQIRAVYRVDGAKTLNTLAAGPVGKARIALEYALRRTGPMSMAPSQLGAFTRSSPERAHPNIEFHVQPLSLEAFGEPLHPYPAFTASVCNLNPTSRGRVELRGSDPAAPPAIRPNYLATEEDRTVAAESLRVVRGVVAQPALARFRPEELKPGPSVQSDEALAREAGNIATTIFHPVGTTAMGRDGDPAAVLDPHLRVRDGRGGRIAGLRVVDAGAMPVIPSGNTNAPVLMMAEKAARWIRAGV